MIIHAKSYQWVLAWYYCDVIMSGMASQITCVSIDYSTVSSDADQTKYQSSASLAFVLGIHRSPVNSPHKRSVPRKMFPFDDVIVGNRRSAVVVSYRNISILGVKLLTIQSKAKIR